MRSRWNRLLRSASAGTLALAFALGCSGGGGGGTPPPPAPDFSIAVTPPAAIQAGSGGTAQVSATRSNGHSAALTLSLAGNTPGITGSGTVAAGALSGTLAISVPAGAAPATYALTLNAADGSLTRSASLSVTVTPGPDFSLAVDASQPIPAGLSGGLPVAVTRSNGHTAALTLGLNANPQGVTGGGGVAAGAGSGALTLNVPAAVAPGAYPLVATATDGSLSHTANFTLTVAPAVGFSLGLGSSSATVLLGGQSAPVALTLARSGGYAESVAFAVDGLPAGVSAAFSPAATTGLGATLVFTAGIGAATGTANLSVRATGTGQPVASAPLSLSVNPNPPTPLTVGVRVNGAPANATLVAWRDGTGGAWTVLSGSAGSYGFTVTDPGGRFSLAAAYAGDASIGPRVRVLHFTVGELKATTLAAPPAQPAPPSTDADLALAFGSLFLPDPSPACVLSGHINGAVASHQYELTFRKKDRSGPPVTVYVNPQFSNAYSQSLPQGTYTVELVDRDSQFSGRSATLGEATLSSSSSTLDFSAGGSGWFNLQPLTVNVDDSLVPGATLVCQGELVPQDCADNSGSFLFLGAGGRSFPVGLFPSAQQPPGSIYRFDSVAFNGDFSKASWQSVFQITPPAASMPMTIPRFVDTMSVNTIPGASGAKQVQASPVPLTRHDMAVYLIRAQMTQPRPPALPFYREDLFTQGWLNPTAPTGILLTPDLGSIPGWNPAWNLQPGQASSATIGTVAANQRLNVLYPFLDHGLASNGLVFDAQTFSVNFIP